METAYQNLNTNNIKCTNCKQHILVGSKVIGFTWSYEAFFINSSSHNNLPFVDSCPEHRSGCFHWSHLLPLWLLVVVCKHLIGGFTSPARQKWFPGVNVKWKADCDFMLMFWRGHLTCHLFFLQYNTPVHSLRPHSGRGVSRVIFLFQSISFFYKIRKSVQKWIHVRALIKEIHLTTHMIATYSVS